jgi:hypothetical protein
MTLQPVPLYRSRAAREIEMTRGVSYRLTLLLVALLMLDSASTRAQKLYLEDLRQTRDRPLFAPTRRVEAQRVSQLRPVQVAPVVPIEPPSLLLVGVVLGSRDQKVIVATPPAQKPLSFSLGGDIDGWRISAIEARAFILERERRSIRISFPSNRPTANKLNLPKGLVHLPG